MLAAVIFDFDGVLVDSEPLHHEAMLQVCRPLGATFDYARYLDRYVGFDDRDALRAILRDAGRPDLAADAAALERLCREKGDAFAAIVGRGVKPVPGTRALIDRLRGRLPLAIASGATRRDIDLVLGGLGLANTFDLVVSADEVQRSKPDPETYRLAVAGLARRHPQRGVAPGGCLAIEDTAAGIESARAAGLWTLGLATTTEATSLHRAHRVAPSLEGLTVEDLQQWFG